MYFNLLKLLISQRIGYLNSNQSLSIAFFCCRFLKGYGVDLVVANQASYLARAGHKVCIYTLEKDDFFDEFLAKSGDITVITLPSSRIHRIMKLINCDVAIAHTDPFFDLILTMNSNITKIAWDYGEPTPELFPEQMENRKRQKENRRSRHHLFHKSVAISEFIKRDMGLVHSEVVYCGFDHLMEHMEQYRQPSMVDKKLAEILKCREYPENCLQQDFLVCIARLGEIYRNYKGTDDLASLSRLTGLQIVLVGRSDVPGDVEYFKNQGLICLENLNNEELVAIYLKSKACVSLSKWEGYNLPLVEAMGLGKMAFALDCGAHIETGAFVAPSIDSLSELIKQNIQNADNYTIPENLTSWKENTQKLRQIFLQTRLKHLTTCLNDENNKGLSGFFRKRKILSGIRTIQSALH